MSRRGQKRTGPAPADTAAGERAIASPTRFPEGEATSARNREGRVRLLARLMLVVGLWGTIAPYIGPEVPVKAIVEVVDHVVPGVVVLAVALFSLYRRRLELITCGLSVLAALWMFTTHVPLLAQAARGEFPWGGSLWMFVPSTLILALTVWAAMIAWRDEAERTLDVS